MKLKTIASHKFIWQNSFNCNMIPTPWALDRTDSYKWIVTYPWNIIGYTLSPINAREGSEIGVMFSNEEYYPDKDNGLEELWCHTSLVHLIQMGYEFNMDRIPEKFKKGLLLL
jgi:hypothetical protein